jgi:predicted lipid-binding transport protein (Tim44 family)
LAIAFLLGPLLLDALRQDPIGAGLGRVVLQGAGIFVAVWLLGRRWARPRRQALVAAPALPPEQQAPPARCADLDQGVQAIRRTDRGFDAARFAGYGAMMFRDVQRAGVARDAGALRDRVTPAMYVELEARCHRLRASGRSACVAEMEVTSEVIEAWQDGTRDYVTAYIAGSMRSHTVDDATGQVVDGSPVRPAPVEAFLTFTRPAGLNFWMLSVIQADE